MGKEKEERRKIPLLQSGAAAFWHFLSFFSFFLWGHVSGMTSEKEEGGGIFFPAAHPPTIIVPACVCTQKSRPLRKKEKNQAKRRRRRRHNIRFRERKSWAKTFIPGFYFLLPVVGEVVKTGMEGGLSYLFCEPAWELFLNCDFLLYQKGEKITVAGIGCLA